MRNKKILILGSKESFSIEKMYERAFKSICLNVNFYHVYNIRKSSISKFFWKFFRFFIFKLIRKKILKYLKSKSQNYDLIIIFKGIYVNPTFLKNIKLILPNVKVINIFTDNPFDIDYFKDISNENILRSIHCFDHLFIYSKKLLKKLKKIYPHSNFKYLPFASDNKIHKKSNLNNNKRFDLSFIGTADVERFNYINFLKEFKIILAGDGWENFPLSKNVTYIKKVYSRKFADTINKSLISLNILRLQNKYSHNMKTFEIPAMGGLMLTQRSSEQQNFFPENKASLMYKNRDELKSKIIMVKKNPNKFNIIRLKGYYLSKKHTYLKRSKFILNTIF